MSKKILCSQSCKSTFLDIFSIIQKEESGFKKILLCEKKIKNEFFLLFFEDKLKMLL